MEGVFGVPRWMNFNIHNSDLELLNSDLGATLR